MSIDWNKPIRWTEEYRDSDDGKRNLRVLARNADRAVLVWDTLCSGSGPQFEIVTNEGRRYGREEKFVENVPEEPKDHLHLYHVGGKWHINTVSGPGGQIQAKEFWDRANVGGLVVKVPA